MIKYLHQTEKEEQNDGMDKKTDRTVAFGV